MTENNDLRPEESKLLNEITKLSNIRDPPRHFKGKQKMGNTYYYEAENGSIIDLNLNSAGLETLPKNIGVLTSLKKLSLVRNKLTELPESIGSLKSLEILNAEDNKLISLPDSIGNLGNLKELSFKSNNLISLPESIGNLGNLEEFNFRRNKNIKVPDSLGNLKSLKKLDMGNNDWIALPESVARLESLEYLILDYNHLESLPGSFGNLRSLVKLDLFQNKLTSLPDSIGNLKALQELKLDWNEVLTSLPDSIGNLKALKRLFCAVNNLTELPDTIGGLESLEALYLNKNRNLSTLPESIGDLKNLKHLELVFTHLETLPESIGNLSSLEDLNLNYSRSLTSLPRTIGKLENLKKLFLEENKFTSLPNSIWPLKGLKELSLKDNPFKDEETYNIIKKPIPAILEYCRNNETLNVFLSHAVVDFDYFNIQAISEYLKDQNEIYKAYYCEEDLIGGIDAFMNNKVPDSQLILFFASKKSVFDSKDCTHELELARKNNIQIIPIKGADVNWEDLARIGLARDLGFEYNETDIFTFCEELFNYIVKFKAEVNLFESQNARIGTHLFNIKNTIENLSRSEELQELVKSNMKEIEVLYDQLNKGNHTPLEYLEKFFELIFKKP